MTVVGVQPDIVQFQYHGLMALVGIFLGLIGLAYVIVAGFVFYKLLLKKPSSFIVIALVSLFTGTFLSFFVAVAVASFTLKKKRDEIHRRVYASPDDVTVREALDFYTKFQITNRPEEWQSVRNLWHAINGSPNVSVDLKKQILAVLLSKGLFLSEAEKRIR